MFKTMVNNIRRWVSLLFGKHEEIDEIIGTQVTSEHYDNIEIWKQIYAGNYPEWHTVSFHTIEGGAKTRQMKTLNLAKVSAERLAKIVFSERVEINIGENEYSDNMEKVLKDNRFYKLFQDKIEKMFALGGLVLKVYPEEKYDGTYELKINYVTPDSFIPTEYSNDEVTEGAFVNITEEGDKTYYLFEIHEWVGKDKLIYSISNKLYEENEDTEGKAVRIPLAIVYPDLQEETIVEHLNRPLFQYIKPNVSNNLDLNSPLGIPIYGNALDTLHSLDTAFDSFFTEFKLGKRRIIVPQTAITGIMDPVTGVRSRFFDANDEVYQAMNFSDPEKQKIIDNTVNIRVEEHIMAINALLEIYSMQIGFSSGSFTFDGNTMKTATEIISEQSSTYQTKQANENLIEEQLDKFIRTLGDVASLYEIFDTPKDNEYEIEFFWDDSIIQDRDTDAQFFLNLKNNDLISNRFALMEILNLTEEQAQEMLDEITEEKQANMVAFGFDDLGVDEDPKTGLPKDKDDEGASDQVDADPKDVFGEKE